MMKKIYLQIIILLCIACSKTSTKTANKNLFTLIDSNTSGITFQNEVTYSEKFNVFSYRNFYNGGGVAIGDINNDGLLDIYFTSNQSANKLYLNQGNLKFKDITDVAKIGGEKEWSTGVTMVDINNDGWLDIYVCNAGNFEGKQRKNELFINQKNLTFKEEAKKYNLDEEGTTTHASFFDYDKDGDLDVYLLNNSFIPINSLNYNNKRELRAENWNVENKIKGGGDKLLQNDNGKFTDVSEKANILGSLIGFGLGVTVGDVNNDNYLDIYVSNDFYERDYLYINQKNGTFKESITTYMSHISQASMGADMADINNDGFPDILVTDMLPENDQRLKENTQFEDHDLFNRKQYLGFYKQYMHNTLQLNTQEDKFIEIAHFSGVAKTDWSWGGLFFDMNNDGYNDIYICNGIHRDFINQDFVDFFANNIIQKMYQTGEKEKLKNIIELMPSNPILNYAFINNKDLTFKNKAKEIGLNKTSFSNGAAYGDLDNDGDLDLIINNVNQTAFFYENNSEKISTNNYIKIKLIGSNKNRFAIGSKIYLYSKKELIYREVIPARGFQSSVPYINTIGIGTNSIDSLKIIWPDTQVTFEKEVSINSTLEFNHIHSTAPTKENLNIQKTALYEYIDSDFLQHKEDNYTDFDYEGLIKEELSKEGPAMAIGDINNDQLNDIYVGGAFDDIGKIYIQQANQKFTVLNTKAFVKDQYFEDTAVVFFDIDNDNDQDLLVGAGGNRVDNITKYQLRLYENIKGDFKLKKYLNSQNNVAVFAVADYDEDGDLDVFVGYRSVTGIYGINPPHKLFENDGKGNFKNIIQKAGYLLKDVGMITDAKWADIDNDQKLELIVVGDWESPKIFTLKNNKLKLFKTNLDSLKGWWNACYLQDLNNDHKIDLVIGNEGTNITYKPTVTNPIKMYVSDFDDNGTIEQVFTRRIKGENTPIALKREMTNQIVSLKKKNLKFSVYAKKNLMDLFDEKTLSNAIIKEINTIKSIVLFNMGNGQFKKYFLPKEAQFSSINAIYSLDVNNDNRLDLILAGNNFNYRPQYGRLDANKGLILLNHENQSFYPYSQIGLNVEGEVKHILPINKDGKLIIIGVNNKSPQIVKFTD